MGSLVNRLRPFAVLRAADIARQKSRFVDVEQAGEEGAGGSAGAVDEGAPASGGVEASGEGKGEGKGEDGATTADSDGDDDGSDEDNSDDDEDGPGATVRGTTEWVGLSVPLIGTSRAPAPPPTRPPI